MTSRPGQTHVIKEPTAPIQDGGRGRTSYAATGTISSKLLRHEVYKSVDTLHDKIVLSWICRLHILCLINLHHKLSQSNSNIILLVLFGSSALSLRHTIPVQAITQERLPYIFCNFNITDLDKRLKCELRSQFIYEEYKLLLRVSS